MKDLKKKRYQPEFQNYQEKQAWIDSLMQQNEALQNSRHGSYMSIFNPSHPEFHNSRDPRFDANGKSNSTDGGGFRPVDGTGIHLKNIFYNPNESYVTNPTVEGYDPITGGLVKGGGGSGFFPNFMSKQAKKHQQQSGKGTSNKPQLRSDIQRIYDDLKSIEARSGSMVPYYIDGIGNSIGDSGYVHTMLHNRRNDKSNQLKNEYEQSIPYSNFYDLYKPTIVDELKQIVSDAAHPDIGKFTGIEPSGNNFIFDEINKRKANPTKSKVGTVVGYLPKTQQILDRQKTSLPKIEQGITDLQNRFIDTPNQRMGYIDKLLKDNFNTYYTQDPHFVNELKGTLTRNDEINKQGIKDIAQTVNNRDTDYNIKTSQAFQGLRDLKGNAKKALIDKLNVAGNQQLAQDWFKYDFDYGNFGRQKDHANIQADKIGKLLTSADTPHPDVETYEYGGANDRPTQYRGVPMYDRIPDLGDHPKDLLDVLETVNIKPTSPVALWRDEFSLPKYQPDTNLLGTLDDQTKQIYNDLINMTHKAGQYQNIKNQKTNQLQTIPYEKTLNDLMKSLAPSLEELKYQNQKIHNKQLNRLNNKYVQLGQANSQGHIGEAQERLLDSNRNLLNDSYGVIRDNLIKTFGKDYDTASSANELMSSMGVNDYNQFKEKLGDWDAKNHGMVQTYDQLLKDNASKINPTQVRWNDGLTNNHSLSETMKVAYPLHEKEGSVYSISNNGSNPFMNKRKVLY